MMLQKRILFIVIIGAWLAGCTPQPDKNVVASIEKAKNEKLAYVPSLPVFPSATHFKYTASDLRNPFQTFFVAANPDNLAQKNMPDMHRHREALESYPIDSLMMVGTLARGGVLMALLKDKTGTIHRAYLGNYIGQNSGKIQQINEKSINITEWLMDGKGEWREHEVIIPLMKAKE